MTFAGRHYRLETAGVAQAAPAAAPAAHPRRQRQAAVGRARRTAGRRVQHADRRRSTTAANGKRCSSRRASRRARSCDVAADADGDVRGGGEPRGGARPRARRDGGLRLRRRGSGGRPRRAARALAGGDTRRGRRPAHARWPRRAWSASTSSISCTVTRRWSSSSAKPSCLPSRDSPCSGSATERGRPRARRTAGEGTPAGRTCSCWPCLEAASSSARSRRPARRGAGRPRRPEARLPGAERARHGRNREQWRASAERGAAGTDWRPPRRSSRDVVGAGSASSSKRRETVLPRDRPAPDLAGKTVLVVDDGLATGSTMLAAVQALRSLRAGSDSRRRAHGAAADVRGRSRTWPTRSSVYASRSPFYAVGLSY